MDYNKLSDDELELLQKEYREKEEDLRMEAAYFDDEYDRIDNVLNARHERRRPEKYVDDPNAIIKINYHDAVIKQMNSGNRLISLLLNEEQTEKYTGQELVINIDTEHELGA